MAHTSRINPATMPTKRVPPPPQGVAPLRKSIHWRITKKKSNDDSDDDDDEEPLLLKSPPEPLATKPTPRAHGDDYDNYATMPPRAHGDDYDE